MSKKNFLKHVMDYFQDEKRPMSVKDSENKIYQIDSETMAENVAIQEILEDGSLVAVEDKTIILDDEKTTLVIEGGMIKEIQVKEDEEEVVETPVEGVEMAETFSKIVAQFTQNENFAIIKSVYTFDYDTENTSFKVGTKVSAKAEEGQEAYSLSSGTYQLEDGRMITLDKDGIVVLVSDDKGNIIDSPVIGEPVTEVIEEIVEETEVKEVEDEVSEEMENQAMESFNKLTDDFSKMKNEFDELKKKYTELSKKASTSHTQVDANFRVETEVKVAPKSILHSMIKKNKK